MTPSDDSQSASSRTDAPRDGEPPPPRRESPVVLLLRRVKHGLRALSPALHDRMMAAYRGSGQLHQRLEALKETDRIDELAGLVEGGKRRGVLEPEVAGRLAAYVRELRREARAGS